jgi:hypothetical protein
MANRKTQTAMVLEWLRTRGGLTNREAVTELGIMSCPKRIEELRSAGHDIDTVFVKSSNGARYGVYVLHE